MIVFLLALAIGIVLATCAPVVQFAVGLLLVTAVGLIEALWLGSPLFAALGVSAACFGLTQVGYVVGLGLLAALRAHRHRKRSRGIPSPSTARAVAPPVDLRRTTVSEGPPSGVSPGRKTI